MKEPDRTRWLWVIGFAMSIGYALLVTLLVTLWVYYA